MNRDKALTLAIVGDVVLERDDPGSMFELAAPILHGADVAIANNEAVYAEPDETVYPPPAIHQVVLPARMAEGLRAARFTAMTMANNHAGDGGHRALLATRDRLRALGIATTGAGEDITAAREPARFEAGGKRFSLLGYTSVMPFGYEARAGVPGLTPLRASTFYDDPNPNEWVPGVAPRIRTVHWPEDLAEMQADVAKAAEASDIAIVFIHQGNSQRGDMTIDEYERVAARSAVDAGARIVVCCHHHSLRGAEFYKGAPIFYGLGNFAFDLPHVETHFPPALLAHWQKMYGENAFGPKEGYPTYPFPAKYRNTAIAAIRIEPNGHVRSGFVPVKVQPDGRPRPLAVQDPAAEETIDYIRRCVEGIGSDWQLRATPHFISDHGVLEMVPA